MICGDRLLPVKWQKNVDCRKVLLREELVNRDWILLYLYMTIVSQLYSSSVQRVTKLEFISLRGGGGTRYISWWGGAARPLLP